jgi:hypothetical protein
VRARTPENVLKRAIAEKCPGGEWHQGYYIRFPGGFFRTSIQLDRSRYGKGLRYVNPCTIDVISLDFESTIQYSERIRCPAYTDFSKAVIETDLFDMSAMLNEAPLNECLFRQLEEYWKQMADIRACDELIWRMLTRQEGPYLINTFEAAVASTLYCKRWDRWPDLQHFAERLYSPTYDFDYARHRRAMEMFRSYPNEGEEFALSTLERLYVDRLSSLKMITPKQYTDALEAFRSHCWQ